MAFGARRVYPNDLRPRVAIGVDIPFSEPGVFTPNYQTRDAVKNNLVNYLLTNPGERIQNPTFGAGLRERDKIVPAHEWARSERLEGGGGG